MIPYGWLWLLVLCAAPVFSGQNGIRDGWNGREKEDCRLYLAYRYTALAAAGVGLLTLALFLGGRSRKKRREKKAAWHGEEVSVEKEPVVWQGEKDPLEKEAAVYQNEGSPIMKELSDCQSKKDSAEKSKSKSESENGGNEADSIVQEAVCLSKRVTAEKEEEHVAGSAEASSESPADGFKQKAGAEPVSLADAVPVKKKFCRFCGKKIG